MACALLTTLFFGGISWRRENATYPALLLVVIGIECASFGRIRELAVKLGGTCVAYALITTTTVVKYVLPILTPRYGVLLTLPDDSFIL